MDDSRKKEVLKDHKPLEKEFKGVAEEQTEEQSSNDYLSYHSTDTSSDLGEYKYLLDEPIEPIFKSVIVMEEFEPDEDEKETLKGESGIIEILSEQTELSDESAWEEEAPQPIEELETMSEKNVSFEPIKDTHDVQEEAASEQISDELEEIGSLISEEIEEEEEEQFEHEEYEEWDIERKIEHFHKDLEEVLNYQFPETMQQEDETKLMLYESMLRELEKQDKEIDVMIKQLDKNTKTIHVIDKTLGPLITHYEKDVSTFRKVGGDSFLDLEGEEEEEEEDVEDEGLSRAAEMAKEILEADDIESVGSLGKESSGDDLSKMLSQMALDLKESEPEVEKEDQSGLRKVPFLALGNFSKWTIYRNFISW